MVFHTDQRRETPPTRGALVRLLRRMDGNVRPEASPLFKLPSAQGARKTDGVVRMLHFHVTSQSRLIKISFFASFKLAREAWSGLRSVHCGLVAL